MKHCVFFLIFCFTGFLLEGTDSIIELDTLLEVQSEGAPSKFTSKMVNGNGCVVWKENVAPSVSKMYFWSEQSGTVEIDIFQDLVDLGFEPIQKSSSVTNFKYGQIYLDDAGNVFISFEHKTPEDVPSHKLRKKEQNKIGVWNLNEGFRYIKVPHIDHILKSRFSNHHISLIGLDSSFQERCVVLKNSLGKDKYAEMSLFQSEMGTPWDKLPVGEVGKKLYVLQKLYNSPFHKNKHHLKHSVRTEAAHILDILQYQLKKAEYEIQKAEVEGIENSQAEKDLQEALNRIAGLKNIIEDLGMSSKMIFSLDLPSKNWDILKDKKVYN